MAFSRRLAFLIPLFFATSLGAIDQFQIVDDAVSPGQSGATITIQGSNDQDMHSLSLALTLEGPITFIGFDFTGTAIEAISPMGVPDFVVSDEPAPGQATLGVIFELMPGNPPAAVAASPSVQQDLVHVVFDVSDMAAPGTYDVRFTNGLGAPAINNLYSFAGQSVFPSLTDGLLTVTNTNIFRVADTITQPGNTVVVPLLVTHDDPYQGFQAVISWDNTILTNCSSTCGVTGIGTQADMILRPQNSSLLPGSEPWEGEVSGGFVEIKYEPGAGGPNRDLLTAAAVFDFLPPFAMDTIELTAGTDQSLLYYTFTSNPAVPDGTTTEIRLEDGLGSPPQINFVILSGFSVTPIQVPGTVTFDVSAIVFQRGDVNRDGTVNLADMINIIDFLFNNGATPLCLEAANTNDDASIDISDVIWGLTYLFNSGLPPFQPFFACGVDTTLPTQGCIDFPSSACP